MKIGIGGSRGTRAVSSGKTLLGEDKEFSKYGGLTTSALIENEGALGKPEIAIVDAGGGLHSIGEYLVRKRGFDSPDNPNIGGRANMFLTHTHLDHVTELPANSFVFSPSNKITLNGPMLRPMNGKSYREVVSQMEKQTGRVPFCATEFGGGGVKDLIDRLLTNGTAHDQFPVESAWMQALEFRDFIPGVDKGKELRDLGYQNTRVDTILLNHPRAGSVGYRFSNKLPDGSIDKSILYLTDFQPDTDLRNGFDDKLVKFIAESQGRLILYMDSQYERESAHNDYNGVKSNWGHSTAVDNIRFLEKAGVVDRVDMILFGHHDPFSEDGYLDSYEARAKEHGRKNGIDPNKIEFAKSGSWYSI